MKRNAIAGLAAALAVFLLSGCSLSALTAENVMVPPQAYGDGAAIQAALESDLGPQIKLCYPRRGEYRSAVVRADVDGDEQEEAIVFYRLATESSGTHMSLLDADEEGEWTIIGEYADTDGEIDRIMFGDLDGDGALDIITGWSVHSDYGVLHVHSCAAGRLRSISIASVDTGAQSNASYAELSVGDFDGDSMDELLTVCLPGNEDPGEARLLKWNTSLLPGSSGSMRVVSTIALRSGARSYTNCTAGMLNWNTYGCVVDSLRTDGSYTSELLVWDRAAGSLLSPSGGNHGDPFSRTLNTQTSDVNNDGYLEIPGDSLLPNCSPAGARKVYLTSWYRYSINNCTVAFSAVMRSDDGYCFIMPDSWNGRVTAQPDAGTRTMIFYLVDNENPFSEELLRIKVFTLDEWDEELASARREESMYEYTELCTTDYYVYAVHIARELPNLSVDYETVTGCFVLLV